MLTFQWQVNSWRAVRRRQRHVSRLCHPFPSPLTTSRLASLADLFSLTPIFFFPFSPIRILVPAYKLYISLNTNSCTLKDCTFALGDIIIPCSLFTSHFSIAFKCEPSVTRVSNCLSVLVVLTDFKAVIYITRGSTVSFNLNRKKNLNTTKTRVNESFISFSSNFITN